jgi:hypothetical protein
MTSESINNNNNNNTLSRLAVAAAKTVWCSSLVFHWSNGSLLQGHKAGQPQLRTYNLNSFQLGCNLLFDVTSSENENDCGSWSRDVGNSILPVLERQMSLI